MYSTRLKKEELQEKKRRQN